MSGRGVLKFIQDSITPEGSLLITDEFRAYNAANNFVRRAVINHSERYAEGITHTNSIEGFWSLLKRAWHGQHHHYSKNHMPLYIAEACWKYNNRKNDNGFGTFLNGVFS